MCAKVITLGGSWQITRDELNNGKENGWQLSIPATDLRDIEIPVYMPQNRWILHYPYSKVFNKYHGYVWYYHTFTEIPDRNESERIRVEFDRAGYVCETFINGHFLGRHMHHEERFSYDVTDYLKPGSENLLAVRCFEPCYGGDPIEGLTIDNIPNGIWSAQWMANADHMGGILNEVRLVAVPTVRIDDIYLRANAKNGHVTAEVTILNETEKACEVTVNADFSEQKLGTYVIGCHQSITCVPGKTVFTMNADIPAFKLWDINSPFLYLAHFQTDTGSHNSFRFGFRTLENKNGYFMLNGKRILLKSAHAAPTAQCVFSMKAHGFNCIRMIHRLFDPEVLDLCDQIGMLVLESPLTSWGEQEHENTDEQVRAYCENMVHRDRNRVCICAFYLYNETRSFDVYRHGRDDLPRLRQLDRDHMFFMSSGRWEGDRMTGSICNPDSDCWDGFLGAEGQAEYTPELVTKAVTGQLQEYGMGDLHPYSRFPILQEGTDYFRKIAANTRPVMITENGIGSQEDIPREYLDMIKNHDNPVHIESHKKAKQFIEDSLEKYGMHDVFPFAEDFVKETHRINGRQRQQQFDIIRANPKICGFSLTTYCEGNEGTVEGEYVIKENVGYALQSGWAPLRWSLFADRTVYADRPFTLEAVLCNEDVLSPGTYKAEVNLHSRSGVVYDKAFDAVLPKEGYGDMPPLALTVLKEEISIPAGKYQFSARLLEGAPPFDGERHVTAVSVNAPRSAGKSVALCAMPAEAETLLTQFHIHIVPMGNARLILAGTPNASEQAKLLEAASEGKTVIFIDSTLFVEEGSELLRTIAGKNATCVERSHWLYHEDFIAGDYPVFENICAPGIVDFEEFGSVHPTHSLLETDLPCKTYCASIECSSSFATPVLCRYTYGKGSIILSCFNISGVLGKHPYADQLLLNLVSE